MAVFGHLKGSCAHGVTMELFGGLILVAEESKLSDALVLSSDQKSVLLAGNTLDSARNVHNV